MQADGSSLCVSRIRRGESLGELTVLDGSPNYVTCTAVTASSLVLISREGLDRVAQAQPQVMVNYLAGTIGRLARVSDRVLQDFLHLRTPPDTTTLVLPQHALSPVSRVSIQREIDPRFDQLESRVLQKGDVLVDPDCVAELFFVLVEGTMELLGSDGTVTEVSCSGDSEEHAMIGLRAFMASGNYDSTVVATTECVLMGVEWRALVQLYPSIKQPFIQGLSRMIAPSIRHFCQLGFQRTFRRAGELVARSGDTVKVVFVMVSGRVRSHVPPKFDGFYHRNASQREHRKTWYDVCPGQTIGMTGFFTTGKHVGTSYTTRTSELVKVHTDAFRKLCIDFPKITLEYAKRSASRSALSGRLCKRARVFTIAVLPMSPAGVHDSLIDAFCVGLVRALGDDECCHVTLRNLPDAIKNVDSMMKTPRSSQLQGHFSDFGLARLTSWVTVQQERHKFVLLQAEGSEGSWSEFCVKNADCVLLAGLANPSPAVLPHEMAIVWGGDLRKSLLVVPELVLLHEQVSSSPLPRGTANTLDSRPQIKTHHHIRASVQADCERLARHIAGRSTGLVLGGGGSRGLAHLGVLRAMCGCEIPIDSIAGTSQGSFVAAVYAASLDHTQAWQRCELLASKLGSYTELLKDLTLPFSTYFHGERFTRTVWESLGLEDRCIEDLWIPFFCVTTNVSRSRMQLERRGSIRRAVRASMSIAGLVPPMYKDGDLLVDGGYCNNMPCDVMRQLLGDRAKVIAVDVENKDNSAFDGAVAVGGVRGGISGWRILFLTIVSKFVNTGFHYPSHSQIQSSLAFMTHSHHLDRMLDRHDIDLLIRPPAIQEYNLLDYHKLVEIEQMGFEDATEKLEKWWWQSHLRCVEDE
eukprot:TRINITY_DN8040_c0_g1_i7.p1 TRINITY_DN8040_c0_g1~~TRINITY_DN8040_c0_g1_i7.p1  ORF type:complete len:863 (+),score=168.82 TRINITY_DN8040_c0_g1_i7:522-3110(+)